MTSLPPDVARIVVAAAVIERDGTFLLTRRLRGVHLEGCWEFPGGKCEPGESHARCLEREIMEELGAPIRVGQEILATTHQYPERAVELHFLACALLAEPQPLLGQEMRWVQRAELESLEFPPADEELIGILSGQS
ncbi:MAG: (deoxy)nucleoside triphosphate pyrophosphohydrolase [Acidobacteriota bacterium]